VKLIINGEHIFIANEKIDFLSNRKHLKEFMSLIVNDIVRFEKYKDIFFGSKLYEKLIRISDTLSNKKD
jgi:hypothetical protein